NGQKCRRKDITDLFMGTGLGPRSYAIIEQGTISRLIESKPQDLRTFIEEAAGISRYKERRRDTENRIRHTRENLERLGDIRSELGKQLEKLAQQAKSAKQYRELKQAERKTHAELLVMRYQELQAQLKSLAEQISTIELQQAAAQSIAQTDELQSTQIQLQLTQLAEQEQRAVEAYYLTGTDIAKLEQQLQSQKQRDAELESQLRQVNAQLKEHTDKLDGYQQNLNTLNDEQQQLAPSAAELKEIGDELQCQWEQSLERSEREAHRAREQAGTLAEQQLQLELRRSTLAHQLQLLTQKQQQNLELKAELSTLVELEREDKVTPLTEALERITRELEQKAQLKQQCEQKLNGASAQLDRARSDFDGTKQQITSMGARFELVEQWLAQQQQLTDTPQLWQQISVAHGWEAAVELALQGLLTVPVGVMAGEVGFTTPTAAEPQALDGEGAGILSCAVNLSPWTHGLKWRPDLPSAKASLPSLNAHERIVTADGYLLGQGFLITKQDSAPSLVQLSNEQAQLAQDIGQEEARLALQQGLLTEYAAQLNQIKQEFSDAVHSVHQGQLTQTTLSLQLQNAREQAQSAAAKRLQLEQALQQAEQAIASLSEQVTLLQEQEETLESLLQASLDSQQQTQQAAQAAMAEHHALKARMTEAERQWSAVNSRLQAVMLRCAVTSEQIELQQTRVTELRQLQGRLVEQLASQAGGSDSLNHPQLGDNLAALLNQQQQQQQTLQGLRAEQSKLAETLNSIGIKQKQELGQLEGLTQRLSALKLRREGLKGQAQSQLDALQEQHIVLAQVIDSLPKNGDPDRWQSDLDQIRQKIVRLGAINLAAIEEFEQQSERKSYLDHQDNDLNNALATLEEAIRKIDKETRSRFKATFDSVNEDLGRLFPKVFGGGRAYLALTEDDLLETGVTIMAQPPGKKNSTIHLLSGGEKALTALSLVFAIFRLNPAPFCMLDEVDAPLDDANVERFCRLLKEMSQSVQFIYISHNKITMEMADQLIGVTMHEPGVSRIVAVDLEQAVAMADAG
ncbi:MAG: chromosome segregation protein SMC, partial [Shewanella sp.]